MDFMIIYHWAENFPHFWIHSCYKIEEARHSVKGRGLGVGDMILMEPITKQKPVSTCYKWHFKIDDSAKETGISGSSFMFAVIRSYSGY